MNTFRIESSSWKMSERTPLFERFRFANRWVHFWKYFAWFKVRRKFDHLRCSTVVARNGGYLGSRCREWPVSGPWWRPGRRSYPVPLSLFAARRFARKYILSQFARAPSTESTFLVMTTVSLVTSEIRKRPKNCQPKKTISVLKTIILGISRLFNILFFGFTVVTKWYY